MNKKTKRYITEEQFEQICDMVDAFDKTSSYLNNLTSSNEDKSYTSIGFELGRLQHGIFLNWETAFELKDKIKKQIIK